MILMNIEKLKDILSKNNKVTFKLYSMDYVIELLDNKLLLYSPTYPHDKRIFKDILKKDGDNKPHFLLYLWCKLTKTCYN